MAGLYLIRHHSFEQELRHTMHGVGIFKSAPGAKLSGPRCFASQSRSHHPCCLGAWLLCSIGLNIESGLTKLNFNNLGWTAKREGLMPVFCLQAKLYLSRFSNLLPTW